MITRQRVLEAVAAGCVLAAGRQALAQTHAVHNADAVVRAVGVYEWTGPETKPTASRLVPVTVFINGQLQDAGVYLARPVPFALQTGTVFEVRKAGVDAGTLELAYQRHYVTNGQGSYDDGWEAVGAFKPIPKEPLVASRQKGPLPRVEVSGTSASVADDSRPHFSNRPSASNDSGSKSTVDRSGAAGGGTTVSTGDSSDSSSDVDRPTLRRRTPDQVHSAAKTRDQASVSGVGSLNDDPDRPTLHRGKPTTRMEESDLPPLRGVPAGMHQEIAVSDAKDRPEHDYARPFESDTERAAILAELQGFARTQLHTYGDGPVAPAASAAAAGQAKTAGPALQTAAPAHQTPAHQTPAQRRRAAAAAKAPVASTPGPATVPLKDETLTGYTLSYGGAATYVYSASAAGSGGVPRYVTLVAQRDPLGALKIAFASVTDGAHLDRTPWYRLVDAVDAEASNRASLLFELRGQSTRAFALYRVIGAEAEQTFVSSPAE